MLVQHCYRGPTWDLGRRDEIYFIREEKVATNISLPILLHRGLCLDKVHNSLIKSEV